MALGGLGFGHMVTETGRAARQPGDGGRGGGIFCDQRVNGRPFVARNLGETDMELIFVVLIFLTAACVAFNYRFARYKTAALCAFACGWNCAYLLTMVAS